jgi:hypothetical protein
LSWEKEREHRAKVAAGIVSPAEHDRRKKQSPARVEARIASAVEALKKRAVPVPTAEPDDPERVARIEQEVREKRRADTARRMKAPVIVEQLSNGALKFKQDRGVSERKFGSGTDTRPQ